MTHNTTGTERQDLEIEGLELKAAVQQVVIGRKRALRDLGPEPSDEEVDKINAETDELLRPLELATEAYNARARAHVGYPPADSDIPEGVQGFLDAMGLGPNTTVIRVSFGSFPIGGFDPTDAPAASWGDENLGGLTPEGARYGSGSADGPE